jgi:cysteinyl-tRNA synthetase
MLKLFNTFGKKIETFKPVNRKVVAVFTCGPSVYQRSHVGNFRTFLFEDVLVRYFEYSGYTVKRGMTVTDIEDKAIEEAAKRKTSVKRLADENLWLFVKEMRLLRMKMPDYLSRASESVQESVGIIKKLLSRGIAYRHDGNIYFDPTRFPGFGQLYGLDMTKWPKVKRRFHKDTYPGMRWNRGDFILWHGCGAGDAVCLETEIGKGRPAWNVQDPSMVARHFSETLSVYCGGIDNLVRHHDYSRAVLESVRPYPMARFWLHCLHLRVKGQKMSKSKGNIYYVDTLLKKGYSPEEIRFFLIYGHYRERLNYTDSNMKKTAGKLRDFRGMLKKISGKASSSPDEGAAREVRAIFAAHMDNDLDVRSAFDALCNFLTAVDVAKLKTRKAAGIVKALKECDRVLQVIFPAE